MLFWETGCYTFILVQYLINILYDLAHLNQYQYVHLFFNTLLSSKPQRNCTRPFLFQQLVYVGTMKKALVTRKVNILKRFTFLKNQSRLTTCSYCLKRGERMKSYSKPQASEQSKSNVMSFKELKLEKSIKHKKVERLKLTFDHTIIIVSIILQVHQLTAVRQLIN